MIARESRGVRQDAHGVAFAEMVKHERTENDVVRLGLPGSDVSAVPGDFRIRRAETLRDGQGRLLSVNGLDVYGSSDFSREINDQPRDVAGAGRQIENATGFPGLDPFSQEISD